MNRCHQERISLSPLVGGSAYSENPQAYILLIPQHRVNGSTFSLPLDLSTFRLEKHQVPRLETGNSTWQIPYARSTTTPEKSPNRIEQTPGAYADNYAACEPLTGTFCSGSGRTPIRCMDI